MGRAGTGAECYLCGNQPLLSSEGKVWFALNGNLGLERWLSVQMSNELPATQLLGPLMISFFWRLNAFGLIDAHMHVCAGTLTYMHTSMHAHTPSYMHTCMHTLTYRHTRMHAHTHMHAHRHAYTLSYTCTLTCVHRRMHAHMNACTHACMYTFKHKSL